MLTEKRSLESLSPASKVFDMYWLGPRSKTLSALATIFSLYPDRNHSGQRHVIKLETGTHQRDMFPPNTQHS